MNAKKLQAILARNQRYAAAPGAPFTDQEAEVVGCELDRIEESGQPVTPDNIVLAAMPEDSPLHGFFTWDNDEAADQWRKQEARSLVSHLLVVVERQEGEAVAMKARISVTTAKTEHHSAATEYVSSYRVLSSPSMREQLLHEAKQEIRCWARKYAALGLTELSPLFMAVENWVE
jgi:hypothetical protein